MSTSLPELASIVVHRPRLSQLLDAAVSRPVTLLTAPPGWGKTAALRSWLDHRAHPGAVAWLSTQANESIVAARVADVAARLSVEDSDATSGPLVVVCDDVTRAGAASPALSPALNDLVQLAGPRLRLVLATRDNTALPVPQWRLSDRVSEIGCAELAFTLDETAHMLATHEVTLPTPEIAALYARAEGWPAGIRFATLRADSADPLTGERHDVERYLEAEVLGRLPARVRELLRRTSLLDRVSGELANALIDPRPADTGLIGPPPDSGAANDLEELSAAGGFVLSLGGAPAWYRYHHQFRQALQSDLRRTQGHQIGPLHATASYWLSEHGLPVEAIRHAWASGDRSRVASVSVDEAGWADLALSGCHVTAPDHQAAATVPSDDPELALAYVVDQLGRGDARAAGTGLDLMDQYGQSTMAAHSLRLAQDRIQGDLTGIDAAATALLELTDAGDVDAARLRSVALATKAASLLGAGDLAGAGEILTGAQSRPDDPLCARRAIAGHRALLLAVCGQLRGAEQAARAVLGLPACQGQPHDVHSEPAYLALALVSHEWDRAAEADRFFDLAARARQLTVEPELAAWRTLIGTRLQAARGDLTGAFDTLRAVGAASTQRLQPWFAAAEAELRIAHGDTGTARAALAPLVTEAGDGTQALSVLMATALLRDGDPHAAARTLPPWSDDDKADAVLSVRLAAGLVDAQVARTLGDRRRAAQLLERVLDLAEPQGFRRPFTTDGLRDLLAEHLDSGTAHWSTVSALVREPPPRPAPDAVPAGEALTEREITVLRYLQSMLSNEEIAAKLFVSVNTVKTHVRHIYRKLDVTQRRDAVRRARELRLL